ncbi:hypothetical protein BXZ70DRAFT_929433 [Cristinia sonorae]|uniref:BTB domain-containing protein n=1 Tax=Cristinia sonorae TaxID=1940300 RepID=A0A8K0US80_9AGAR|nr:hypothetical protein BXZ70DRAFT_929433 [Cristinia sonorae]
MTSANENVASEPFDDVGADIILRTSDGVDFYIYRIILSLSSPFFKSMFSLKQPKDSSGSLVSAEGQHIIPVQECSRTLDFLLRLCYPIPDPDIQTIEDIGNVLEAAMKYEMEQPTKLMRKLLLETSTVHPLRGFAVACRLRMDDEAKTAARLWRAERMPCIPEAPAGRSGVMEWSLTLAGQTYIEQLDQVSAGSYFRLLRFLQAGIEVDSFCNPPPNQEEYTLKTAQPTPLPTLKDQPADLIVRSSDGVDFPVHKFMISFASSLLSSGVALLSPSKKLPIVEVDEHSSILDLAIQLSYPMEDPELTDPELAIRLLQHATTYNSRRAKDFIRRTLPTLPTLNPLRLFFIAAQHSWHPEARSAVLRLLHCPIDSAYVPEMEHVSARVYRAFLKHHNECLRKVAEIALRDTPTAFLPRNASVARLTSGYARVAPAIYSPMVDHAVSILKRDPFRISYDLEAMRSNSEQLMDELQIALDEVSLDL